jgi:hypothetical protein
MVSVGVDAPETDHDRTEAWPARIEAGVAVMEEVQGNSAFGWRTQVPAFPT